MTAPVRQNLIRARSASAPGLSRISDHEFLPAALEILETPPSPVRLALIIVICALATACLIWSYIGRIDIIAVAQGKMRPTGFVKLIQPLITGKVLVDNVSDGQHVTAGQVLLKLDPSEILADRDSAAADLISYSAEVVRRKAAMTVVLSGTLSQLPRIAWTKSIPEPIREREELVLASELQRLQSEVAGMRAQITEKKDESAQYAAMIDEQKALLSTLKARVDMRAALFARAAGTKSDLIDATEKMEAEQTELARQTGARNEADASISVITRDIQKAYDAFLSENAEKLDYAERQVQDAIEKLAKADAEYSHTILRSPIDGTVQASSITTIGQVVTTGEEIMRIVPAAAKLEIQCYLPNRDIGFVRAGQHAVIKIEAFPFTRYGTVEARVVRVGRDAISMQDVERAETDPARALQTAGSGFADQTQNLFFPLTLVPDQAFINVDGAKIPFTPGMSVTAEIRTGSRRIIEYVFSPLVQVASEAMKER